MSKESEERQEYHELMEAVGDNKQLKEIIAELEGSEYVQGLLVQANTFTVGRLNFNDHGRTHSLIVARDALLILDALNKRGIKANIVKEKLGKYKDAQLVVATAGYLHDVGNAVHRRMHYFHTVALTCDYLNRVLARFYKGKRHARVLASILECMFSHDDEVESLSTESSAVTLADGMDMANGRARIPFSMGKIDIHSLSALSIKKVEIRSGKKDERAVVIDVYMDATAGIFQVQNVLGPKLKASTIAGHVSVVSHILDKDGTVKLESELEY